MLEVRLRRYNVNACQRSSAWFCIYRGIHTAVLLEEGDSSIRDTSTHWGRDKIDEFFETAFWNAFSWMRMFEFRLTFHWSVFLRAELTRVQHWLRWWLGADQLISHYLNHWCLLYWRIYASRALNELRCIRYFVGRDNLVPQLKVATGVHPWCSLVSPWSPKINNIQRKCEVKLPILCIQRT